MNIITPVFAVTLTITSLVAANQATKPIDMPIHDTGTIKFENTEKLKPIETSKLEPKQIKPPKAVASPPASSSVKAEQVSKFSGEALSGSEQEAKMFIYMKESGNRPEAVNPTGCRGLGQACPGSKLPCSSSDYACQDAWFTNYMKNRYGTWVNAKSHWQSRVAINGKDVGNWW